MGLGSTIEVLLLADGSEIQTNGKRSQWNRRNVFLRKYYSKFDFGFLFFDASPLYRTAATRLEEVAILTQAVGLSYQSGKTIQKVASFGSSKAEFVSFKMKFVSFKIEFVSFKAEFVSFKMKFVSFKIEFVSFKMKFVSFKTKFVSFKMKLMS